MTEAMNRRREPLARVEPGLPAGWYVDPGHYQRELEAFWYSRWIAVAREEEIPAPGDWRRVRLATQSLVLLRDEAGALRAFHNTCRHRGSVLCTEDNGSFARRRIVCPYHAWSYDLEGHLVATPRRMETPDFNMKEFGLFEVAADSWGGFVFVKLDKGAFVGSDALRRIKQEGPRRKLVGFEMVGRGIARGGYEIRSPDGERIGYVTTGMPSPTLGKNLGLGYVPAELATEGSEFDVIVRDKPVRARVVKTPFYKPRYKK